MVTSRSLFRRLVASTWRLLTTMKETATATMATTDSSMAVNIPPSLTAIFIFIG
ncbi:hypothetical protein D3C72_2419890 [compost metagenome]